MVIEHRTRVRHYLSLWLFVLSGVAYLDRTNISIVSLDRSRVRPLAVYENRSSVRHHSFLRILARSR
jgi:hypothetical protein